MMYLIVALFLLLPMADCRAGEAVKIEQEKIKFAASLKDVIIQRSVNRKKCMYMADGVWVRKNRRDDKCYSNSPGAHLSDADLYELMEEVYYERRGGRPKIILTQAKKCSRQWLSFDCCLQLGVIVIGGTLSSWLALKML